jgi:hypothetical protein
LKILTQPIIDENNFGRFQLQTLLTMEKLLLRNYKQNLALFLMEDLQMPVMNGFDHRICSSTR